MKAKEFDAKFDRGEDITEYLDVSKARRPEQEQKRVNVDFPLWIVLTNWIKRQNVWEFRDSP